VAAPTISIRYVLGLLNVAEHRGASRDQLCRAAGLSLPVSSEPDSRVPIDTYYDLWQVAVATLQDPYLPIRVAKRMDAASFDALGFAIATSATFGDALLRTRRFLPFVTDAARWDARTEADHFFLTLTKLSPPRPEQRYADEFSFANMLLIARTLAIESAHLAPAEVRFRHPEPGENIDAQREFFRCPLRFDAPRSELVLSRASLALPLRQADEKMVAFFDALLEKVIRSARGPEDLRDRLRKLIVEGLARNSSSLEDIAKQLALSPRTLRRRLAEEGFTFQGLVEDVRQTLAEHHLRERRLTIGEIAFALGYSDVSAFHRAFRRWTGSTPESFRLHHFPPVVGQEID
jgi:AraC-like DNA-binding protein